MGIKELLTCLSIDQRSFKLVAWCAINQVKISHRFVGALLCGWCRFDAVDDRLFDWKWEIEQPSNR